MLQETHKNEIRTGTGLTSLMRALHLDAFQKSWNSIGKLRKEDPDASSLLQFMKILDGHRAYLAGAIDVLKVSGLEYLSGPAIYRSSDPVSAVLSPIDHPHARVVVVRCMDNRNTCSNVPLNLSPVEVCEISSAGHILRKKILKVSL